MEFCYLFPLLFVVTFAKPQGGFMMGGSSNVLDNGFTAPSMILDNMFDSPAMSMAMDIDPSKVKTKTKIEKKGERSYLKLCLRNGIE